MDPVTRQQATEAFREIELIEDTIRPPSDSKNELNTKTEESWGASEKFNDKIKNIWNFSEATISKIDQNLRILKKIDFSYLKQSRGVVDCLQRIFDIMRSNLYCVKASRLETHFKEKRNKANMILQNIKSLEILAQSKGEIFPIIPDLGPNYNHWMEIFSLNQAVHHYLNQLNFDTINEDLFIKAKKRLVKISTICTNGKTNFRQLRQFQKKGDEYEHLATYLFTPKKAV
jgi:hypothetical protein